MGHFLGWHLKLLSDSLFQPHPASPPDFCDLLSLLCGWPVLLTDQPLRPILPRSNDSVFAFHAQQAPMCLSFAAFPSSPRPESVPTLSSWACRWASGSGLLLELREVGRQGSCPGAPPLPFSLPCLLSLLPLASPPQRSLLKLHLSKRKYFKTQRQQKT